MAKKLTGIPNNITEYPNSFKRQGAFPLEAYELFYSKADAEKYAKENPIAYVGQTIKVFEENSIKSYIIKDTTGTLYSEIQESTSNMQFDTIDIDGGGVPSTNPENWTGEF